MKLNNIIKKVLFQVNYIKASYVQYIDREISTWRYEHDFNEHDFNELMTCLDGGGKEGSRV